MAKNYCSGPANYPRIQFTLERWSEDRKYMVRFIQKNEFQVWMMENY